VRSGRRPMTKAAKKAHHDWTVEVLSRFCCEGQRFFAHECDYQMDAAHIIPKRVLKDATLGWPEDKALAVIFDVNNGLSLCRAAHNIWDGPYCPVRFEDLPDAVFEFAGDLGMIWKLESMYPPREESA